MGAVQLPEQEISTFISCLYEASQQYPSIGDIQRVYQSHCLTLIPDRMSAEITEIIGTALEKKQPFSVIRIGDGEANLLTYGNHGGTPELDRFCADEIIASQQDTFRTSEAWLLQVRQWLHDSIMDADVVGVRGVDGWSQLAETNLTPRDLTLEKFLQRPRSLQGLLRSEEYMLRLAKQNLLADKIITSAHLYFGVLSNIRQLLEAAERIVLITNRKQLKTILSEAVPPARITTIAVGNARSETQPSRHRGDSPPQEPHFLNETLQDLRCLGSDLEGALCLIGAGPWSELYCSQAKQLGAIAVDLGSGLDLLCGIKTRPVHKHVLRFLPQWPAPL